MLTGKELRLKRLLLLANSERYTKWRDHKQWYSQYYQINGLYTDWFLGMAFLTEAGLEELCRLTQKQKGLL